MKSVDWVESMAIVRVVGLRSAWTSFNWAIFSMNGDIVGDEVDMLKWAVIRKSLREGEG
jgi:hypothetical protein